jgi:hypothetical protein
MPIVLLIRSSSWAGAPSAPSLVGTASRPHVGYDEQLADVVATIERMRSHARDYGGDPAEIFLVGGSAGAYLAVDAVNAGTAGIAGIVPVRVLVAVERFIGSSSRSRRELRS